MRTVQTLHEVRELAAQHAALYVRYSAGPAADKRGGWASTDHGTGTREAGLSVNRVVTDEGDAMLVATLVEYEFCRLGGGVRGWLCTGTVVGRGADGEPVLADVAPLAWVGDELQAAGNGAAWRERVELAEAIATELQRLAGLQSEEHLQRLLQDREWYPTREAAEASRDRAVAGLLAGVEARRWRLAELDAAAGA